MKIIFFIVFSSITLLNCLELDFKIKNNSDTEKNIMNILDTVSVEVDLSFGSKNINFKPKVNINNYCIAIPGMEVNNDNIQKFDTSDSTTFKEITTLSYISSSESVFDGILGEDKIKFGKKDIEEMKFIVASSYSSYNSINDYSYIGLGLFTNQMSLQGTNILEQLKNKSIIDKQTWYLKFDNFEKGKLVFGKYINEDKDSYNKDDNIAIELYRKYGDYYKIEFDEINYGNKNNSDEKVIMQIHKTIKFSTTTRLIYSTYEYGEVIYNKFFSKKMQNNQCFSGTLKQGYQYIYFYCKKNETNINEMENLNFILKLKELEFTLEPKDLFYEYNGLLYFLIVYKPNNPDDGDRDTEWIVGLQFLKKYIFTFNRDDKVAYYNNKVNNSQSDDNNKEDDDGDSSNSKYIIIIMVLIVLFGSSIGFLVYYIIKIKPRRKKANELEEGFDYESKNDNIVQNEEGKLGV